MKEYIERNFALYVCKHFGGMLTWCKEDVVSEIIRVLNNTPAADVVEVRHAKWVSSEQYNGNPECPVCFYVTDEKTNYCPNCGAKMDKEE